MTKHLNILAVAMALVACGGESFSSQADGDGDGAPFDTGGAVGVTDDAAVAAGGTRGGGGAAGSAGGVLGSRGGAGGAGAGGEAGASGGALGGAGGAGGALAAGGGTAGTGGDAPGSGGAAGGAGACLPPVVTPESLPQQVVWESYTGQVDTLNGPVCLRCQESPCATCAVTWWPVTQSDGGLTLTASASVRCDSVPVSLGACGIEPGGPSCVTWPSPGLSATLVFSLQPHQDGGYSAVYRTLESGGATSYRGLGGGCPQQTFDAAVAENEPMWSLFDALRAAVVAAPFPCGP